MGGLLVISSQPSLCRLGTIKSFNRFCGSLLLRIFNGKRVASTCEVEPMYFAL